MRVVAACLVLGLGGAATGCGGASGPPAVRVAAAASLREALTRCAPNVPGAHVSLSFGGSDELAAQIRQGVRPDVFAAASTSLPRRLAAAGLVDRPVAFATNELVLAVPSGSAIRSLDDLLRRTPALAIGGDGVPVGTYTRELLGRLPATDRRVLLGAVRSEEPDVKGVVGKLLAGAVGAGFVYRSDVKATSGRLRAVALPAGLRPRVAYGLAMVRGGPAPKAASLRTIADLLHGGCARALRAAGLGAPAP